MVGTSLILGRTFLPQLKHLNGQGEGTLVFNAAHFKKLAGSQSILLQIMCGVYCGKQKFSILPIRIIPVKTTGKIKVRFTTRFAKKNEEPVY